MLSLCTRYFLGLYEQRHGYTLRGSELVIGRTSYFLFFSCTSWLVGSQFTGWQWKCRVLTTGPSGNPQTSYFSYINRKCLKSGVIIWDLWKQSLRQLVWEFYFREGSKRVVKQKSGKASTGTVIDQPPSQATRAWFRRFICISCYSSKIPFLGGAYRRAESVSIDLSCCGIRGDLGWEARSRGVALKWKQQCLGAPPWSWLKCVQRGCS